MGFAAMAEQQEQMDIGKMPVEQLQQLKKQLEAEVAQFQNSIVSLKYALTRYEESNEALCAIKPENEGKKMLVPLTNSLYCAGSLGASDQVLVDIGTGYHVGKTPEKAAEFFSRKREFCTENINRVQALLAMKRKNLESVSIVTQQKVAAATGGVG